MHAFYAMAEYGVVSTVQKKMLIFCNTAYSLKAFPK